MLRLTTIIDIVASSVPNHFFPIHHKIFKTVKVLKVSKTGMIFELARFFVIDQMFNDRNIVYDTVGAKLGIDRFVLRERKGVARKETECAN